VYSDKVGDDKSRSPNLGLDKPKQALDSISIEITGQIKKPPHIVEAFC
jgi:hypothetical protein